MSEIKNEKTEKDMEIMDTKKSGIFDKVKSATTEAGKKIKYYATPFTVGAAIGTVALIGFSLLKTIAKSNVVLEDDLDDIEDFEESEDIMEDEVESSDEDAE